MKIKENFKSPDKFSFPSVTTDEVRKEILHVDDSKPGYAYPKRNYQLVENFYVYLPAKNQLHPPCFLQMLEIYANLF